MPGGHSEEARAFLSKPPLSFGSGRHVESSVGRPTLFDLFFWKSCGGSRGFRSNGCYLKSDKAALDGTSV